jgi:peptide methionine sulfoxide reductase MsrA
MYGMAFVLAFLICASNARRFQLQNRHLADVSKQSPSEAFAAFLFASHPTRGWHIGTHGNTQRQVRESSAAMKSRSKFGEEIPLQDNSPPSIGRRQFVGLAATAAATAATPRRASAEEASVKVYFGAGCFWHVQHEFVGEETAALSRSPSQVTAISGYAGGIQGAKDNKVCYHNPFGVSDYGQLGHAEVVQLDIPESALPRFAQKYFSLFGTRGYRHDPQDRGGEYRSAIGLPGGKESPYFDTIRKAALESPGGMKLFDGKGDEPDTIGDKAVLVYDSSKFPFYPAEVYHQFHNDFMGPAYGRDYNALQKVARDSAAIAETGCPEMQGWMS